MRINLITKTDFDSICHMLLNVQQEFLKFPRMRNAFLFLFLSKFEDFIQIWKVSFASIANKLKTTTPDLQVWVPLFLPWHGKSLLYVWVHVLLIVCSGISISFWFVHILFIAIQLIIAFGHWRSWIHIRHLSCFVCVFVYIINKIVSLFYPKKTTNSHSKENFCH